MALQTSEGSDQPFNHQLTHWSNILDALIHPVFTSQVLVTGSDPVTNRQMVHLLIFSRSQTDSSLFVMFPFLLQQEQMLVSMLMILSYLPL